MEQSLIQSILLGKSELFEQIVLEYQDLVFTVCLNIIRNRHDAENIAQETFISAYCSLSQFRGGNLKSWLCRIAVNKSIDFKRRDSKLELAGREPDESGPPAADTVEELFERKERKERLEKILSDIPDKYSSVVKAFYYGRLPVKAIARRLELPEKTVETRLYRARKIIKERWGEDGA
ncbi:MAG: sigma-70 family RNA polymerase sigma factor [Oscillospiraceae bacterium]|nr:sigma-70 family RNA polymerase sigma factor [Oscillospiraceae bacterium]